MVLWSLITLFFSVNSLAEYRVYQFSLKNKVMTSQTDEHIITTTLDPQSYVSYHGGPRLIAVNLLRTWMCPGNTARKPLCSSPYKKAIGEMNE